MQNKRTITQGTQTIIIIAFHQLYAVNTVYHVKYFTNLLLGKLFVAIIQVFNVKI